MRRLKGLRILDDPGTVALGRMRIGGAWDNGRSGQFLEIASPAKGAVVGALPFGTQEDAARAVAAAVAAKARISRLSVWARSRLCLAVVAAIEARSNARARLLTLEQGNHFTPRRGARSQTFGPVAPLLRFRDGDEARDIIGRSRFDLSAAVFTSSINAAFRWAEGLRI